MTQGSPGFQGSRLREARESRAINQVALADLIGVTRQAVSAYESGEITPAPAVARKAAEVLKVSPNYFRRAFAVGDELGESGPIFYRSLKRDLRPQRTRASRRYDWLGALFATLVEHIEFPAIDVPLLDIPSNPLLLTDAEIETHTTNVRSLWDLGNQPIGNMVWLLENHGIMVTRDEFGTLEIDAFSAWRGDIPFIVLGTEKNSAVRSRFDAAHELAHLVLHRNIDQARIDNSEDHKVIERQANKFASALLLPAEGYGNELLIPSLDEFVSLKPRWGASVSSQLMRSTDLNLVGEFTAKRMWKQISAKGWKIREPLDDKLTLEYPMLFQKAVEVALTESLMTVDDILEAVPVSPEDVEGLIGLRSGTLMSRSNAVVPLPPQVNKRERRVERVSSAGNLVQFPSKSDKRDRL